MSDRRREEFYWDHSCVGGSSWEPKTTDHKVDAKVEKPNVTKKNEVKPAQDASVQKTHSAIQNVPNYYLGGCR